MVDWRTAAVCALRGGEACALRTGTGLGAGLSESGLADIAMGAGGAEAEGGNGIGGATTG